MVVGCWGEDVGGRPADLAPEVGHKTEPVYRRVLETGEPVLEVSGSGPTGAGPERERHWLTSYAPLEVGGYGWALGVDAAEVPCCHGCSVSQT